jgi:hypothetical protein
MSIVQQVHFMMLERQRQQLMRRRRFLNNDNEDEEPKEESESCLIECLCLLALISFVIYMVMR